MSCKGSLLFSANVAALKLTPLRIANIPPPMSFRDVTLESVPVDVAISPDGCRIAVLRGTCIDLITWKFEKQKLISEPELSTKILELDASQSRQISFLDEETLGVVYDGEESSVLQTISVPYSGPIKPTNMFKLPENVFILRLGAVPDRKSFWYESNEGNVSLYNPQSCSETQICGLPAICPWLEVAVVGDQVGTYSINEAVSVLMIPGFCLRTLSKRSTLHQ